MDLVALPPNAQGWSSLVLMVHQPHLGWSMVVSHSECQHANTLETLAAIQVADCVATCSLIIIIGKIFSPILNLINFLMKKRFFPIILITVILF